MSTNNQTNSELSSSTDQQIDRTNSITTDQFQSNHHQQTSTNVEEIDVAQADQSDRSP